MKLRDWTSQIIAPLVVSLVIGSCSLGATVVLADYRLSLVERAQREHHQKEGHEASNRRLDVIAVQLEEINRRLAEIQSRLP